MVNANLRYTSTGYYPNDHSTATPRDHYSDRQEREDLVRKSEYTNRTDLYTIAMNDNFPFNKWEVGVPTAILILSVLIHAGLGLSEESFWSELLTAVAYLSLTGIATEIIGSGFKERFIVTISDKEWVKTATWQTFYISLAAVLVTAGPIVERSFWAIAFFSILLLLLLYLIDMSSRIGLLFAILYTIVILIYIFVISLQLVAIVGMEIVIPFSIIALGAAFWEYKT